MAHTVKEIAAALGAEAFGAVDLRVSGAAEPARAGVDDLALAMSPAYAEGLDKGHARAAIVWPGADWQALGLEAAIVVSRARLAMSQLTQMLDPGEDAAPGIHPTAIVDSGAKIGRGVSIGAFTTVAAGAVIGDGCIVASHCSIGPNVVIGVDGLVFEGVRLRRNVKIGARVILQPNVVIGADGFSFVTATPSNVEKARETLGNAPVEVPEDPTWHRIHSLGSVKIGDDVEVGANSTIDAGTIRPTQVGNGTKIDNLVQVGHNVVIGAHCLLCAQAAVAGSAVIGDRVVLGGKAGVADNITLGDDVVLSGAAIALSNVAAGRVMMGYPAVRMQAHIESYKALRRLPRVLRDLRTRQKPVSKIDESD